MKLLKIITTATIATVLLVTTAFASVEPEVTIAKDGLRATISGTIDVEELGFVTAQVKKRAPYYPLQIVYKITNPETGELIHVDQVQADKRGNYSADFILNADYGDCNIVLYTAYGKVYEGTIDYLDGTVDAVNKAAQIGNKDDLYDLMKLYNRYIGLDLELFNKYTDTEKENVLGFVLNYAPYNTKADLKNIFFDASFNIGLTTQTLTGEEKTQLFNDYMDYLGDDYDEIAAFIAKNNLGSTVIDIYNEGGIASIKEGVKALALRAFLKDCVQNVFDLDALFTDDNLFEIPSETLKKYKKITKLQEFYTNLYNDKDDIKSLNDFYDTIIDCIPNEKDEGDQYKKSSGGGGGGTKRVTGPSTPASSTTPPAPVVVPAIQFKDLDSYAWAKAAIEVLAGKGAINGDGNGLYNPAGNITREQFAKIAAIAFNINANGTQTKAFTDVNATDWFCDPITALVSNGMVNGISDTEFGVGKFITRQDAFVILARIAGLKADEASDAKFADDAQIADYARSAVYALRSAGKLNGYNDGTVRPAAFINRAEAAQLIYSILN